MMANLPPAEEVPVNAEGVQEVMLVVSRSGYTPIHFAVKAGIPVRLIFRQLGYVPGGNELNVRWGAQEGTYCHAHFSDRQEGARVHAAGAGRIQVQLPS